MRRYSETMTSKRWGCTWETLNPGLKQVHIGDGVWLYGRQNLINKRLNHMVIYAPDRKTEHHVFGETVNELCRMPDHEWGGFRTCVVSRDGNVADEAKVKIYILTSILDERKNWCFDLNKIPRNGKLKVIYHNGTVKNIDFDGTFEKVIKQKYASSSYKSDYMYMIPVAYRIDVKNIVVHKNDITT